MSSLFWKRSQLLYRIVLIKLRLTQITQLNNSARHLLLHFLEQRNPLLVEFRNGHLSVHISLAGDLDGGGKFANRKQIS